MKKLILLITLSASVLLNSRAQETNISNGTFFEGEPFLAVNPKNHQNMVVAWMGFVIGNTGRLSIKVKTTFNGGKSWSSVKIMPHIVSTYKSADPSLAFDGNGKLFLSYIDYRENPDSGGVYIFKSLDGGLNWGSPVKLIDAHADAGKSAIDRPWLTINSAGDKLYVTTKPAPWIPAPNRPYLISSSDSGKSWSSWQYIDTIGNFVGNLIQAPMAAPAASGSIFYAVYPSYLPSQSVFARYLLAKTTNMGKSFTYSVALSGSGSASNDTAKLGYKLLVNPSNPNHLAFVYLNQTFGDIDVMLIESTNGGTNWSSPYRVNDDAQGNGKMQDLVWADFSPQGDLAISWRDRRNAQGTGYKTASEFFTAFRFKDSLKFAPNTTLGSGSVAYHPILEQNGNDFMGMVFNKDTISAVWGNTKDGSLDIWFVRKVASTGKIVSVSLIESESPQIDIFPNPSNSTIVVHCENSPVIRLEMFTLTGVLVSASLNNDKIDVSGLQNGIYLLKIYSGGKAYSKKVVIAK